MREVEFRQAVMRKGKFHSFHFWGYVESGVFVGPLPGIPSEQYIGFKDRSGHEIYEGDVLDVPGDVPSDASFPIQIKFANGTFCMLPYYILREARIIGNIHGNPELAKSPKGV